MAVRKSKNLLPNIFQTDTNEKFLSATLDQLISEPVLTNLYGYIGRKFAPTFKSGDSYITEASVDRQNYQLESSVVVRDESNNINFFSSYPDFLNKIKYYGGIINDHSRLFEGEFYTFDPRISYDKLVNFSQYYWLPDGPNPVEVNTTGVELTKTYNVTRNVATGKYVFSSNGIVDNSVILPRGGVYRFVVNQPGIPFWIQTELGIDGLSNATSTIGTREVLGVENNGTDSGVITFSIPQKTAQERYTAMQTVATVDYAAPLAYSDLHNRTLSWFRTNFPQYIGITGQLDGKQLVFIDQDQLNNRGEEIWTNPVVEDNEGNTISGYDAGIIVDNDKRYGVWRVQFINIGIGDPLIRLVWAQDVNIDQKVYIRYGVQNANKEFYKDYDGFFHQMPLLSSLLDSIVVQDGLDPDIYNIFKIVEYNNWTIDVDSDIVGRQNYTSPNGVNFTSGLKIQFDTDVTPTNYQNKQYYVESVGDLDGGIKLVPVDELVTPEAYIDENILNYPDDVFPEYITINRASKDRNAWARNNRWFHREVIQLTADYRNEVAVFDQNKRATRPIIQFEADLQLFNEGRVAKKPIDIVDFNTTNAFVDFEGKIFDRSFGVDLIDGTRIIFVNDIDSSVKNKIYTINRIQTEVDEFGEPTGNRYIKLVNEDGDILPYDTVVVTQGNYKGTQWWFDGSEWKQSQQKTQVQQSPLYDVFDSDFDPTTQQSTQGQSLSTYTRSSFKGTTIFEYTRSSTGVTDSVLGFPLSYRNFSTQGDIEFSNTFDSDTFTYVDANGSTQEQSVDRGFLQKIIDRYTLAPKNTWTTVVEPSKQYQNIGYVYDGTSNIFPIDITPAVETSIPYVKVYKNFKYLTKDQWILISGQIRLTKSEKFISDGVTSTYTLTSVTSTLPGVLILINNVPVKAFTIYTVSGLNIIFSTIPTQGDIIDIRVIDTPALGDKIDILVYSEDVSTLGFYQPPPNLDLNAQNFNNTSLTLGQLRNHLVAIGQNSTTLTGDVLGVSNLRDVDIKQQGGSILQHAAPVPYGELFLLESQANFVDSVRYAQREYAKFKNKFLELSATLSGIQPTDPAVSVDLIMAEINKVKNTTFPWFYSDMIPYGTLKNSYSYTVFDPLRTNYELTTIFSDVELSNQAVLIYLNGEQLINGVDYRFLLDRPAVQFIRELEVSDLITIVEYLNTDGCYVPETPTKLGLWPKFVPTKFFDNTYRTPIDVIRGHDGSITPAFGDYRDDFLLELELRIYNNLKLSDIGTFGTYSGLLDVLPGKFRSTDYTLTEINQIISGQFQTWVGNNRLDFSENNTFEGNNAFTWNYGTTRDRIDGETLPGGWRACYQYFYDTVYPHLFPWEMLGFSIKPSWWEEYYGPAPYTSGNKLLWDDLEAGIIRYGDRAGRDTNYARPGLATIIPVDENGNLLPPANMMTAEYNALRMNAAWAVGQCGPTEYAWRTSSDFPYAVQFTIAMAKPGRYFGTAIDTYNYNPYNATWNSTTESGQFINSNTKRHLSQDDVLFNGQMIDDVIYRGAGYINWIADYLTNQGMNPSVKISSLVKNYQVNLAYKLAGFSDQNYLTIMAEQVSPGSTNDTIVIPTENYKVHLNKSTPVSKLVYSAVIVEKTSNGYSVRGYDLNNPFFTIIPSQTNNNFYGLRVLNKTAKVYKDYQNLRLVVPYGYQFTTQQQVVDFLISYERYLIAQGWTFEEMDEGLGKVKNWKLSSEEFLYWIQQGWSVGSIIVLSPVSNVINAITVGAIVDGITDSQYASRVVDQNFRLVKNVDYEVMRNATNFKIALTDSASVVGFVEVDLVQYEHVLVFDNSTEFNDIIYTPETGNRQYRLKLVGQKTATWDGSLYAPGFIYTSGKVDNWYPGKDYLQGDIISYKSVYYTALQNVIASNDFQYVYWKEIPASSIQAGLLPNFSTIAAESKAYYNSYPSIDNKKQMDFSHGLIGYRPRQFLSDLGLTETSQIEFYKGYIKQKGSFNAIKQLVNSEFNNLTGNINIYEEWAFRLGTYGALDTNPFLEMSLDERLFGVNPSLAEFVGPEDINRSNGITIFSKDQLYKSTGDFNGNIALLRTENSNQDNDILTAGYVNIDDVDTTLFDLADYAQLNSKLAEIGTGYLIWVAKDFTQDWDVYRVTETNNHAVIVSSTLVGYIDITFNFPHNLFAGDIFIVKAFSDDFDAFYQVAEISSLNTVTVRYTGGNEPTEPIVGKGIFYILTSMRFQFMEDNRVYGQPPNGWKVGDKIWIDDDAETTAVQGQPYGTQPNGTWKVYEKTNPWQLNQSLDKLSSEYVTNDGYGASVRMSADGLVIVTGSSNSGNGVVNTFFKDYTGRFTQAAAISSTAANTRAHGTTVELALDSNGQSILAVGSPLSFKVITGVQIVFSGNISANVGQLVSQDKGSGNYANATVVLGTNNGNTLSLSYANVTNIFALGDINSNVRVGNATLTSYANVYPLTTANINATYSNIGFVTIYDKPAISTSYTVKQIIPGNIAGDKFGSSIAFNQDGRWLYVGSPGNDRVDLYGLNTFIPVRREVISVQNQNSINFVKLNPEIIVKFRGNTTGLLDIWEGNITASIGDVLSQDLGSGYYANATVIIGNISQREATTFGNATGNILSVAYTTSNTFVLGNATHATANVSVNGIYANVYPTYSANVITTLTANTVVTDPVTGAVTTIYSNISLETGSNATVLVNSVTNILPLKGVAGALANITLNNNITANTGSYINQVSSGANILVYKTVIGSNRVYGYYQSSGVVFTTGGNISINGVEVVSSTATGNVLNPWSNVGVTPTTVGYNNLFVNGVATGIYANVIYSVPTATSIQLGFTPEVDDVNSLLITSGARTYIPEIEYTLDRANAKVLFSKEISPVSATTMVVTQQPYYTWVGNVSGNAGSSFGYALSSSYDGAQLAVGAPRDTVFVNGTPFVGAGAVYVYDRVIEAFNTTSETDYVTTNPILPAHRVTIDNIDVTDYFVTGNVEIQFNSNIGNIVNIGDQITQLGSASDAIVVNISSPNSLILRYVNKLVDAEFTTGISNNVKINGTLITEVQVSGNINANVGGYITQILSPSGNLIQFSGNINANIGNIVSQDLGSGYYANATVITGINNGNLLSLSYLTANVFALGNANVTVSNVTVDGSSANVYPSSNVAIIGSNIANARIFSNTIASTNNVVVVSYTNSNVFSISGANIKVNGIQTNENLTRLTGIYPTSSIELNDTIRFIDAPAIGKVVYVETNKFTLLERLIGIDSLEGGTDAIQANAFFGTSLTICSNNCAIYIGAPNYNDGTSYNTGAVWKFHNRGRLYGTNNGYTYNPVFTPGDTIRLDNYEITVSARMMPTTDGTANILALSEKVVAVAGQYITQVGTGANVRVLANTEVSGSQFITVASDYIGANIAFNYGQSTTGANVVAVAGANVTAYPMSSLNSLIKDINDANLLGISAVNENGQLRLNSDSTVAKNLLRILSGSTQPGSLGVYASADLIVFAFMQIIINPYGASNEYFGSKVKLASNAYMLVIGSDRGTTRAFSTYDDNTTIFDDNSTRTNDEIRGSGSVYIYELYDDPRNAVEDPGRYAFAQQLNTGDLNTGDRFGYALDIEAGVITVTALGDDTEVTNGGAVYVFDNPSGDRGWKLIRYQEEKVDIDSLTRLYLYSNITNKIIENLQFIDPAKGRILGQAEQEITFKTDYDPAVYNRGSNSSANINTNYFWTDNQIGQVWWNLGRVRFIDYEQDTLTYRSANWGRLFPDSVIEVCEWVESDWLPSQYVAQGGDGVPKYADNSAYVQVTFVDPITNIVGSKYYYWVKDKTTVDPNNETRNIPTTTVADIISNPKNQGVPYAAVIRSNAIILFNISDYLSGQNTILHLDYQRQMNNNIIHSEYELIQRGNSTNDIPENIIDRMIDSLSGVNEQGDLVPDPKLSVADRYGIDVRPRQSMFIDRTAAIRDLVLYINSVLIEKPVARQYNLNNLFAEEAIPAATSGAYDQTVATDVELGYIDVAALNIGWKILVEQDTTQDNLWTIYTLESNKTWSISRVQSYKTSLYWNYVNWFGRKPDGTRYSLVDKLDYVVPTLVDAKKLLVSSGQEILVRVSTGTTEGGWVLYVVNEANELTIVGIENGTIQLNTNLGDFTNSDLGFGNQGYSSNRYDQNPDVEIRKIVRAIKDDIFVGELQGEFNKSFFVMLNYLLSEQKFVDWVFKTSFISATHDLRTLSQFPSFVQDNQTYYQDYINEVKPYRTKLREYTLRYTGEDNYPSTVTDFDLPPYYDQTNKIFRSPSGEIEADSTLWQTYPYNQWLNNRKYLVSEIIVANPGAGYTLPPVVTILAGAGGGSGAAATAYIDGDTGAVTRIEVTNSGSGYVTTPQIVINGNGSTPATAYAIIKNSQVRTFDTAIKFDRVNYTSLIEEWQPNTQYYVTQWYPASHVGNGYVVGGNVVTHTGADGIRTSYYFTANVTSGNTFVTSDYNVYTSSNTKTANDRVIGYYQPTAQMPARDLRQLITGIEYPGVQVQGPAYNMQPYYSSETTARITLSNASNVSIRLGNVIVQQVPVMVDGNIRYTPARLTVTTIYSSTVIEGVINTDGFLTGNTQANIARIAEPDGIWIGNLLPTNAYIESITVKRSGSSPFDVASYDNITYDAEGNPTISDDFVDTIIRSNYADSALGTRAEDINVDGGAYVDRYSSHAPEELIPGITFDTLDMKIFTQTDSEVYGYRVFNNMLRNTSYLRIADDYTSALSNALTITDTTIRVSNSSVLLTPDPSTKYPGVVFIGSERITYWTNDTTTNTLGQIRRGTDGTAVANSYPIGTLVTDAGYRQQIPGMDTIDVRFVTLQFSSNITANIGDYITQPGTGAGFRVINTASNVANVAVTYIGAFKANIGQNTANANVVTFNGNITSAYIVDVNEGVTLSKTVSTQNSYTLKLSSNISANVGDTITQTTSGANARILGFEDVAGNLVLVSYNNNYRFDVIAGNVVSNSNIAINGLYTGNIYPISSNIAGFIGLTDGGNVNVTVTTTDVAVISANTRLQQSNVWLSNTGLPDGTGLAGSTTTSSLFIKAKVATRNSLVIKRDVLVTEDAINTLTTESGDEITEE